MAKGINFCFHGRLGKDPELKYVGKGNTAVCNFRVALNMGEKNGTEWIDCVAWGDTAVSIAEEFKKGDKMWIKESSPKTNKWEYQGKQYEKLQFVVWAYDSKPLEGDQGGGDQYSGSDEIPF